MLSIIIVLYLPFFLDLVMPQLCSAVLLVHMKDET